MVNDIISVNGISKSFGPISALCDVSLSVQQGLVTAIVGDNGSGKSTLIKLLSGNLAPDAGTITVEGREHTHLTIAQALQMGIRTVYQDLSLDDWKNSYENIFLGHERMHGPFLDRCRMEREAAELLKRLEITISDLTQPVRVLSGGQRQGIAIARAMLQPGRLLLLDEPTATMGIQEAHQTMQLLRRLRQEDHTLLIVSHDIYQVCDVADRIFVMRAGRCIADIMAKNSSPEELHHLILEREQGWPNEAIFPPPRYPMDAYWLLPVAGIVPQPAHRHLLYRQESYQYSGGQFL